MLRGRWATLMPISVFKEPTTVGRVVISEISGVQLNRLLVLATRIDGLDSASPLALKEIIESEIARLTRAGLFSFSSTA